MAQPPLAVPSDLAAWVGQDIPADDPRAEAVLSAASSLVRTEIPGQVHAAWAASDDTVPDTVRQVVVQVAARVWLNPAGAVSVQVGQVSRRWPDTAADGLYLTGSERSVLSRYRASAPGLATLSTTRGEHLASVYVPTAPEPAGYPFPWYAAGDPRVP